jgi:hypothetical protein
MGVSMNDKLVAISSEKEILRVRGQKACLKLIVWLFSVLLLAFLGAKLWGG